MKEVSRDEVIDETKDVFLGEQVQHQGRVRE